MTPIDCIDPVSAPTWPALVAITSGHAHQWSPTNMTIRMSVATGRAVPSVTVAAPLIGQRLRRYACLICGAVEDRLEAP